MALAKRHDQLARAPDILSDSEWSAVASVLCLSRREAQMVRQANYDESVSAISERLGVSPNTVHTYRERLYRKLNVSSFCQVVAVTFGAHVALSSARVDSGDAIDLVPLKVGVGDDVARLGDG